MDTSNLRPEIDDTKRAFREKETERFAAAWARLLELGVSSELQPLVEKVFRHAYWMGAGDILRHDVRGDRTFPRDSVATLM